LLLKKKRQYTDTIPKSTRDNWLKFLTEVGANSRLAWGKVRAIRGGHSKRAIVLKVQGEIIAAPKNVANVLARRYSRMSNGNTNDPIFEDRKHKEEKTSITFPQDHDYPE
jgi:hypothetical protein